MTEIFNEKQYNETLSSLLNPVIETYWQLLVNAGVPIEDVEKNVKAAYEYGSRGLRRAEYLNQTYAEINLFTDSET